MMLLPLMFALAAMPAQGDSLPVVTLDEARRRSAAVDPLTVAARAGMSAAAWERRAARAGLLTPSLTAATSYLRFSEPFFNFGTGAISPNATSATFEATYTVLGAGKLGALRRGSAAVAGAEAAEILAEYGTALATDAAYYAVLAERELSRVAADRLRRATEQLSVARVRVLSGETIATDSLQLMLEANRARLEVLRRDSALAVTRLRLGARVGLAGPADAAPLTLPLLPPLPLSLPEAIAEARATGPDLEAAAANERAAAASLSAERAGYLPDVVLSATTGAYDSEFFPSATRRSQLAIVVSLPIWDGGQRELGVARARAQRDIARAERDAREREVAGRVSEAWNGYQTGRAAIELAEVGVAIATETFRVQGARYREGATTILDLLEAQVGLSEAEAGLIQARYGARLALARLEALLGRRLTNEE